MKKTRHIRNLPVNVVYDEMNSPVGKLTIIASATGLHAILWDTDRKDILTLRQSQTEKTIIQTKQQLSEYFQGKRQVFDLPIVLNGTDFQKTVWKELLKIPYAETITYGQQAEKIGNKNKARAVGIANGKNPISIVIPCHRVIGSNGKLVGFAGGLDKKAYLLELEKNLNKGLYDSNIV